MDRKCKGCDQPIPAQRLAVLPHTHFCVQCSAEAKWSAIHVIHHKTGNEVQIVKDPEVAAEFNRLAARSGFGTLRGLKRGNRNQSTPVPGATRFIVNADRKTLDQVGERAMFYLEVRDLTTAEEYIKSQILERVLSDSQGAKIIQILRAVYRIEHPPVEEKPIVSKYNPYSKYEPPTPKSEVSKEIEDAFKQWKK